ncbi:MAG: hypothetical protein UW51_C0006G0193 [Candidatus Amesbacteria bacterium GW2011_GWA1_44_24]|nr:MAG: hypothetical protein UW51_C0006G0193 [Candidatus Amesbacteria bacterium GW2011_GWA1_44_24]
MKNKGQTERLKEEKRDNVYYLMRDILSCFPDKFEQNFLGVINHHLIAKEATRQVLMDEIKMPRPKYRILAGALIFQNAFLQQMQRVALYEVIDVVAALKYCFSNSSFKTVKRLSAQVILRLFATLYFEYIIMPLRNEGEKSYLDEFRRYFSRTDIIDVIKVNDFYSRLIFERHGIEIGYGEEKNTKLKEILNKFYTQDKP